jgi:hypothetical protein
MRVLLSPLLLGCAPKPAPAEAVSEPPAFTWRRGVHVAHWLGRLLPDYPGHSGVPHTYAAPWFDEEDLDWIAGHGFDHVQIHADVEQWFSEAGVLLEPPLVPFETILEATNQRRLGVVLLLEGEAPEAEDWRQIAARFGEVGPGLRLRTEQDGVLAAIRAESPERFVYLPLVLGPTGEPQGAPAGDAHTGLAFSYFWPEVFTYQLPEYPVVVPFPGVVPDMGDLSDPRYHAWYVPVAREAVPGTPLGPEPIEAQFAALGAWAAEHARDRELYMGEFGLFVGNDPDSTRLYLRALVQAAERHGVSWSIYDYESGRAVRGEDGEPTPIYEGLDRRLFD